MIKNLNRRSLIKLVALASPAICESTSMLASIAPASSVPDGQLPAKHMGHPRLFYNRASLDRIRQALAADATANADLKKRGEELLAAALVPESVAEIGGGQHANYGTPATQMREMGLTLGLLYHLSGDSRYASKLREAMLHYVTYVRWAGQGLADRFPQWHSELNTATFSFGFSTGYDALHGFLSEADRKTIAEGMVRLAVLPILNDWVLPGARLHSLDSMGHNWWGVCVAGAGLCALGLLDDDSRAQEWIDAVDAGFIQWFNYRGNVLQNRLPTYERCGPTYEGVSYNNYGVSEYLHYRLAWQNTYPGRKTAHIEPLDEIATFFLQTLYPTSDGFYTVNFDDSGPKSDSTPTMLLLNSCGLGTPNAARYLQLVNSQSQGTLLSLLRLHPMPHLPSEVPTSSIYPQMGWAMMRSSWKKDATLLAVKSGYTWNHGHADAGSFIVFNQGKPLIVDSGTCNYGRPEYNTYYRSSRAHNVLLFNGQGQPDEDIGQGCKFPGHVHDLVDGLGLKYVYADATGPMARWFTRNYRHWLWSRDLILVIDDVRAHAAGEMDWLLHYDGEYTADLDGGVKLKNGGAEAVVKMLYPASRIHEEIGLADHDPDRKLPYLVFHPEGSVRSRQFITAIILNPAAVPKFEVLQDSTYLGVRVRTGDAVEELYLSLRAAGSPGSVAIQVGEWSTDAYLLHLSRPSANSPVQRYFIGDGSYLRTRDRSMFESLSKSTLCWSHDGGLQVFSSNEYASIQIGGEHAPRSVYWNCKPVPVHYDAQRKLVSIVHSDDRSEKCGAKK